MTPELLLAASELVRALLRGAGGHRRIVAIAGPPGAGKSTIAEALARHFTRELAGGSPAEGAVAVPMDGFHLSNMELVRLGLTQCKGAPQTFDAAGFVHLVRRLSAADELVYAPAYSRVLHEPIGAAIAVAPQTPLILVEGNYLLLPDPPWVHARSLYDLAIYVEAPADVRVAGLVRRHRSGGLSEDAARAWVRRSDEANARLIASTRPLADAVLRRRG